MFLPLAILASISFGGNFTQGGLVKINAPTGTKITQDNEEVTEYNGKYYIGFARNSAPTSTLIITYPNGQSEQKTLNISARKFDVQSVTGVDKEIAAPNKKNKGKINAQALDIGVARMMANFPCPENLNFTRPAKGLVTGFFGSQRIYNGVAGSPHSGVDFKGDINEEAFAPEAGKIIYYKNLFLTGNTMVIDHGCGIVSTFMHLNGAVKKVGDVVKKGDVVALIGKTGLATGPHLHWSLNLGATRLDPLLVLE